MSYSNSKVDFLYLNEKDVIKAGVLDMHHCVETMCEVFRLLGDGDFVMGGKNHNSHGILISFPDKPEFPNMPHNGPDRRFMAMTAYLGGRFHVAGEKWYGSNRDNLSKGLPRSILMCMLNDPDTGAPLACLSGNLISAMRTGAIPGVGARYLAREDSKECCLIGAGPISRTCFTSIIDARPGLEKVRIFDLNREAGQRLADFIRENYPNVAQVEVADSLEQAVRGADIINTATSGKVNPYVEESWLKPGAYFSIPAGIAFDQEFVLKRARNVVDNWKLYEAWGDELPHPTYNMFGSLGCLYYDWVEEGIMQIDQLDALGDIIAGKIPGRRNDEEIILFGQAGQPVYDVAWSYEVYRKALELGLGISLNLWQEPYMH